MKPDKKYLNKIEKITFQPIFIQGVHRSGTTILYKILQSTNNFNSVTAYHIIKYDEILYNHYNKKEKIAKQKLTKSFIKLGVSDRGIDKLKVNADFAEEYGFLLGNKSYFSKIKPSNISFFKELCKKVQATSRNKKPILLKNPYDFGNSIYIKKKLSNAKFIFIHRHPYKTQSSLVKAVRHLMNEKNLYASQLFIRYNRFFENLPFIAFLRFLSNTPIGTILLTINSTFSTRSYLKSIKHLPKEDYIEITYDELCEKPNDTIKKVLEFLDIKIKDTSDFSSFIRPRKTRLDPSVIQLKRFIYKMMKPYFKHWGYKPDDV